MAHFNFAISQNAKWGHVGFYIDCHRMTVLENILLQKALHTRKYIQYKNTKRFFKQLKTVKRDRTGKTRATLGLLYCAGECVPYSLLYCLPADVSRRQTVQTANSNKSLCDTKRDK